MDDVGRRILTFERQWFRAAGAKEQAIVDEFGFTSTAYYARLNRLLDDPEAVAADPLTVKRLQRLRDVRRAQRSARPERYGGFWL